MADPTPTPDEIRKQVLADVATGISNFSDGTHNATVMDPEKRLDLADRLRSDRASTSKGFGLRTRKLIPPGCG